MQLPVPRRLQGRTLLRQGSPRSRLGAGPARRGGGVGPRGGLVRAAIVRHLVGVRSRDLRFKSRVFAINLAAAINLGAVNFSRNAHV